MGLGKFLHKATKAVGHFTHSVAHTAEHAVSSGAKGVAHAASDVAVAAGKGLHVTARAVGKVGIGKFNVANASHALTHAGIGNVNLANASKELGRGIHNISKIPVLGSIIGVTTPIHLIGAANNFANGQRIDRSALSLLNNTVKDYKDVAPYAASVVSFVPAVGPGVGASIAAAAALADGKRWDQIAIEAARGAIPGGNIAKAAFDVATATAQGKPLDQVALAAIPIDPKAKQAILAGLTLTRDLAAGRRVDQALLARVNDALNIAGVRGNAATAIASGAHLAQDLAAGKRVDKALIARVDDAIKLGGPEVAKALQVGTAIGTAKKMQDSIMKQIAAPAALNALGELGKRALSSNKALQQGLNMSHDPNFQKGFTLASGIMSGIKATESQLLGVRNALNAEGKKGFDAAAAYFIGKHTAKPVKHTKRGHSCKPSIRRFNPKTKRWELDTTPRVWDDKRNMCVPVKPKPPATASFAYFATHGLVGASVQQKETLVKAMVDANPDMRTGAKDAIKSIAVSRSAASKTFWQKLREWLGL